MLRISIVEINHKRRIVLEGKLVAPWSNELKSIGRAALCDRVHPELVIDLRNVTAIRADGEDVLLILIDNGARFRVSGASMQRVVKCPSQRSRHAKATNERKKA